MKRDLADFWNLLWEAALGLAAAFALANLFAPPQDLPWKPLDLARPIGTATAAQVDDFVVARTAAPEELKAVTDACIQLLREAGVQVERAEDRDDGGFCVVQGAVRLTGGAITPLAPGGLVMQCPMAVRYVIWDRQVLQPAAREAFGQSVARVETYGTYACRRINGQAGASAQPSEHARANALDVAGVTLADGRKVSVLADWSGEGPAGAAGADFLRQIRAGACRVFATVLSPEYNAAHRDHLHLDGAARGLCS